MIAQSTGDFQSENRLPGAGWQDQVGTAPTLNACFLEGFQRQRLIATEWLAVRDFREGLDEGAGRHRGSRLFGGIAWFVHRRLLCLGGTGWTAQAWIFPRLSAG